MRRVLYVLLLVACTRDKHEPPPAPGSPSSSTSVSAKPAGWVAPPVRASADAAPPPTAEWIETQVPPAKLAVKIPKGATISNDRAGDDPQFAGSWFRVKMPSGYDVFFAEEHGKAPIDIVAEKRRYQLDHDKKTQLVYEADDAIVANRTEDPPAGTYCEVTACGKVEGRRICASHAGAIVRGQKVDKLTDAECLAVVAIARSIHAR